MAASKENVKDLVELIEKYVTKSSRPMLVADLDELLLKKKMSQSVRQTLKAIMDGLTGV